MLFNVIQVIINCTRGVETSEKQKRYLEMHAKILTTHEGCVFPFCLCFNLNFISISYGFLEPFCSSIRGPLKIGDIKDATW